MAAKITIVIPIYNVEKYLRQCLDSVVNQSVINHKAILVNDGSTDQSPAIAQEYADRYPALFTYISQINKGLGAARNTGIAAADTEYIMFLDSDDWLRPRTVEEVTRALEYRSEPVDIGFMTPIVYDMANGRFSNWADTELLNELFGGNSCLCPGLTPKMYALEASVCRCVFRREFLREHQFAFPVGVRWEDVFPHFFLFHHARRCIKIDNAGFYYRINSGKQITSTTNEGILDVILVFSQTYQYAVDNKWSNEEIAYMIQMLLTFTRWFVDVADASVRSELMDGLHRLYLRISPEHYAAYRTCTHPSRKERLRFHLFRIPLVYQLLANHHFIGSCKWLWRKLKSFGRG